ncbi:MAG TPA: hypothetical protein VGS62_00060, partial [Streptosporangiaceae bacterium]|nr:hypothetical protein [Streptosporangiaceae bacterium]
FSRSPRPWLAPAVSLMVVALAGAQFLAAPGTSLAASRAAASHRAAAPHFPAAGNLDCNGHSPIQRPLKPGGIICAEVHGSPYGQLYDNGYYIGHDEPTIQFYSNRPGSSTKLTWVQTLPRDPSARPTVNGPRKDRTHFFELMPAMWFSMALCDPRSYPQVPCRPDSDSNSPHGNYPGGGSAFLELQFYPPGFAPFADGLSCDNAHWCAALTIDSLECTDAFTICNNKCVEPVNFAFIQTDGVPTGPPSPQRSTLNSVTPNQDTLRMNPGDKLRIRIFDNAGQGALETQVRDLSTGKTGFMLASAKNGFMNTSIANCSGAPWSYRPLYSTASTVNQGGWAAANINIAYEIGHFTPCTRLQDFSPVLVGSFNDPSWNFCRGPYETAGPPDGSGPSGEINDAPCYKAGDTHGPLNAAPDLVTGCTGGDLDYDGTSYWLNWPESLTPGMFPSAMTDQQPATVGGALYSQIQFLTDNPATNIRCSPGHTAACVVPPPQAPGDFYPYWTEAKAGGACVWEFGQMRNGNSFGQDQQYGKFTEALGLAEDASPIMPNRAC